MSLLLKSLLGGLFTGLLTALAIPPFGQTYLLLLSFIPAFYLLKNIEGVSRKKGLAFWFIYAVIFTITWTIISFNWLSSISWGTYLVALIITTLAFFIFTSFLFLFKKIQYRYLAFIGLFIVFELWSNQSLLATPYTTISPWLCNYPSITQYYSILGSSSGLFWILLVNWMIYNLLNHKRWISTKYNWLHLALIILFPISSVILLKVKPIHQYNTTIALANTNINPLAGEYGVDEEAVRNYIDKQWNKLSPTEPVDLLIYPEGVTNHLGWIGNEANERHIQALNNWRKEKQIKSMLIGGLMYQQVYNPDEHYAVREQDGYYFTTHNVSVQLTDEGTFVQSKEYFIPFQEYIPYPNLFLKLSEKIKNVGYQNKIAPLASSHPHVGNFVTRICYEVVKPIRSIEDPSKQFMVLVASESWTDRKASDLQFSLMLKMIAIKNNITIVKASNQGKSLVVNNIGTINKCFYDEQLHLIRI